MYGEIEKYNRKIISFIGRNVTSVNKIETYCIFCVCNQLIYMLLKTIFPDRK